MITSEKNIKVITELNGVKQITEYPINSQIYVHVTDNGNGYHSINGRVILINNNSTIELGWIKTNLTLDSNTTNLLNTAHVMLITLLNTYDKENIFNNSLNNNIND